MFGYAVADYNRLSPAQRERYRAVYCGLCRRIGTVGRPFERLALTYDLVLLILVLSDVTSTPFREEFVRCGRKPLKRHRILTNGFTDYAAQMNILLAYYKFLDDKADDGKASAGLLGALFRKDAALIAERYPLLSKTILDSLSVIVQAEKENITEPEIPANAFGTLLGAVFSEKPACLTSSYPEKTGQALYAFGFTLGKAIYLMDAAVDLKADLRKRVYNPFVRSSSDHRMRLIESVLAQCMVAFHTLYPDQNGDIVENILLSGIWSVYQRRSGQKKNDGQK